ncbi:Spherulin-1A [Fusarium culmorum]|uniref:Spherulin-1A n=1 Tax=Fusarium culmorum TaxID=5516 RepID=A0A2T4GR04_FUSCU|nr:Spherulin-1A [Fusarium culmorum]
MQFTTTVISAVLAFTSFTEAAPRNPRSYAEAPLRLADTAADFFTLLPDDKDFVFDFNKKQENPGKGGELIAANRKTFPALVGTGSGMAFGRIDACGMNTLHVHPRSAELQIVTSGRLMTEMVPENGVMDKDGKRRVIRTELKANMMTPFYQGSPATFVASFAAEDFGTGQIADEVVALSDDVIAATFGQSIAGEDIDKVRAAIPKSIALGVDECLKKCNIQKRSV